jgi:CRISPR-associated protein Csm3
MRKVSHHQITGTINLLSSMRIGGIDELLQIGATDATVIKHPETLKPYIPGSSLKGKMRSQLEIQFGLSENGGPFTGRGRRIADLSPPGYLVATIFGPHMNTKHEFGPTRIIVRDGGLLSGGMLEIKPEVMSRRDTGVGTNPRTMERVASGSTFRLKIDLQVFDIDGSHPTKCVFNGKVGGEAMIEFVKAGLRLVEQTGLGAAVSRGSGEVEFQDLKLDGNPFVLPPTILSQ